MGMSGKVRSWATRPVTVVLAGLVVVVTTSECKRSGDAPTADGGPPVCSGSRCKDAGRRTDAKPSTDAGKKTDGAVACGAVHEPCCMNEACGPGLNCSNGACVQARVGDTGVACTAGIQLHRRRVLAHGCRRGLHHDM